MTETSVARGVSSPSSPDGHPLAVRHPSRSAREQAVVLRAEGLSYARIGRALGVSETTAVRWASPASAERNRQSSAAAKRRRKGTCRECGASTAYDNTGGVCARCQKASRRIWTAERVIDAIQRFARTNGRPPVATEWTLRDRVNDYPASSNVYRSTAHSHRSAPFQSWADAIEAAGFARPERGRYERTPAIYERYSQGQRRRHERERAAA